MTTLPARAKPSRQRPAATYPRESSSPGPLTGHLTALDGVRGLAIFFILAYHFTLGMTGPGVAARAFAKAASAGWCGVDLFFVLSGFLITGILLKSKDSGYRFTNFYGRRALRIFPLYYGTLFVAFAAFSSITKWVGNLDEARDAEPWLWLYGTNIFVALRGDWFPLSHFWSLAVEEHFYLFWPAIVFWCDRRTVLWICGGMVALALAVRVWLVTQHAVLAAYCLTVCRMDALAMGSFVALCAQSPGGLEMLVPRAVKAGRIASVALLAIVGWRVGFAFHDAVVQTIGYLLLDVLFAAFLVRTLAAPASSPLARAMNFRPLRSLGRYSYGLYVYNSIYILIAERLDFGPRLISWSGSIAAGRFLYVAIAAICTFAAAWISWHAFEKHFLKLKAYFA